MADTILNVKNYRTVSVHAFLSAMRPKLSPEEIEGKTEKQIEKYLRKLYKERIAQCKEEQHVKEEKAKEEIRDMMKNIQHYGIGHVSCSAREIFAVLKKTKWAPENVRMRLLDKFKEAKRYEQSMRPTGTETLTAFEDCMPPTGTETLKDCKTGSENQEQQQQQQLYDELQARNAELTVKLEEMLKNASEEVLRFACEMKVTTAEEAELQAHVRQVCSDSGRLVQPVIAGQQIGLRADRFQPVIAEQQIGPGVVMMTFAPMAVSHNPAAGMTLPSAAIEDLYLMFAMNDAYLSTYSMAAMICMHEMLRPGAVTIFGHSVQRIGISPDGQPAILLLDDDNECFCINMRTMSCYRSSLHAVIRDTPVSQTFTKASQSMYALASFQHSRGRDLGGFGSAMHLASQALGWSTQLNTLFPLEVVNEMAQWWKTFLPPTSTMRITTSVFSASDALLRLVRRMQISSLKEVRMAMEGKPINVMLGEPINMTIDDVPVTTGMTFSVTLVWDDTYKLVHGLEGKPALRGVPLVPCIDGCIEFTLAIDVLPRNREWMRFCIQPVQPVCAFASYGLTFYSEPVLVSKPLDGDSETMRWMRPYYPEIKVDYPEMYFQLLIYAENEANVESRLCKFPIVPYRDLEAGRTAIERKIMIEIFRPIINNKLDAAIEMIASAFETAHRLGFSAYFYARTFQGNFDYYNTFWKHS